MNRWRIADLKHAYLLGEASVANLDKLRFASGDITTADIRYRIIKSGHCLLNAHALYVAICVDDSDVNPE